ncbi:YSIRK-type signal peptide-containing protein, partial [Streptococcus suis]
MSSKDMFRKEQRFSFRKFSFGLASAVIANVIFGGAIASSPIVHANTAEPTSTVAPSERLASVSYTVNVVDQAGTVINTQTKNVSVQTTEATAVATANLTTDLVPEGYALVSGLGQETVTENAENVFTVVVEKATSEVASTEDSAAVSASETSTTAVTSEETSTATSETSTKATSEVANTAAVAAAAAETVPNKTERTAYLSYITHYVNEANETVDRRGHLVPVTTTDDIAKTQVTVSASENMPSGWELVQDKAKVVVQLVENQTNILVFAVTKKSKEEEIAASQLSNRDVLMRLSLEADLLADEALRQVAKEQAGNTALETAANETKAVAATANEVLANDAATETELDDQIDTVRTSTQNLAAEMLKFDEDGVLTAMLDTTQGITITTSSKGAVRPNYPDHIRDYTTDAGQQVYNNQDFFFGLIGKELTEANSQIRATAQASDGSTPTVSIAGGGGEPISTISKNFGLQDNGSGVLYGTVTIPDAGDAFSWQFKASSGSNTAASKFTFVPYTVVRIDETPVRKGVTQGVTADEILAKVKSDVTREDGSRRGPLNATFEEYFNTTLTARATGKSTKVAEEAKNGKQIWHEIKEYVKVAEADGTAVSVPAVTGSLPTEAGTYNVTVLSTNVHGQTIENTVKVVLNAAPTITASGTGSTNPFNTTNPERKIVYIFGITTGDTEAVTTAKAETGEKAKAPIFDRTIAKPVATITDPDSTSIKVNYGDNAPRSRLNNLGSKMVATAADGTVLKATDGTFTNVTVTNGTANIYLGGTYESLPGGKYTRQFIISDESGTEVKGDPFYTVSYTDKLVDDQPIAKNQDVALTDTEVFAKLTLDAQSGGFSDTNPNLTVPVSEVTRTIVGYRTADGVYTEQTDLAQFPKDKDLEVKVKTTNVYGQTVYNWVSVDYNLKPKVEIVDAVEGERKTIYVFSKNNDRTENSEGVTGTNVAFNRDKATKAVVNITDDGQVTSIVYNDGKHDTADMLAKGVDPTTLVGTDGYFKGSVAAPAGTNATRLLKVTDDKGLVGQSPTFRVYAFSDTVPADVTPVSLFKGTSPTVADITAKMVIDSNSGYPDNSEVEIPEDAYTRTVVGYRLDSSSPTVAVDSVAGLPTEGSYQVRVKTSNAYGQEIYNWVPVSHYDRELAKADVENQAAAAKEAIDNNPNLSEAEKKAAKDAVDAEVAKANDAIDKAKTPAEAQTAEEAGTAAIAEDV